MWQYLYGFLKKSIYGNGVSLIRIINIYTHLYSFISESTVKKSNTCGVSNNRLYFFYFLLPGADPGIYFGGAKPRSPIESWGRSPNRGREAPEYRERSPSRGREAPEKLRAKPEPRAKPENNRGRGLGRGLGEPLPRKFLKNQTWNHSFWCIFEAIIWND